ncbi:MAG: LamG-like jellyroll fold domain-containing protein [Candidatus Zipacnadales bacterium]
MKLFAQLPREGLFFNGETSYAVVEEGRAFNLEQFSCALWAKVRSDRPTQVFLNRGGAGELFTLYLYHGNMRMLVEYTPGRYAHAKAPLPPLDQWVHYAGTYDGQQIKAYLNGMLTETTLAPGRLRASDEPLYIGALAPQDRPLDGSLDEVRIYNRALTDAEVHVLATDPKGASRLRQGLIAHWTAASLAGSLWKNIASGPDAHYFANPKPVYLKDDGYRGIWYYNQPSNDEYVYKYSGGLGTYCEEHSPFAVYAPAVHKTFFCYGGRLKEKNELLHMVSYYDHTTGLVPRPTILLNKHTDDAHDNPVIALDGKGYVWIFSSSHGTARPSYIHRSTEPYSVEAFERILTTNFSYPQPWWLPDFGFLFMHTRYEGGRISYQWRSPDGVTWDEGRKLFAIQQGHYGISGNHGNKVGLALNYHPEPLGLNWRTNLYYIESEDFGETWHNAQGQLIELPVTEVHNPALVHDYEAEGLLVYLKDINFDANGHPVILIITSKGYASGPQNMPRAWTTVRWTGSEWDIQGTLVSDSNYDTGSLYIEAPNLWRLIAPTEPGPQPYNPGGEIVMWTSTDLGKTWTKVRQMTHNSEYNHTYVRRPVNAHPEFYGFWADGHARQLSDSRLYFCNRDGDVFRLPPVMEGEFAKPEPL